MKALILSLLICFAGCASLDQQKVDQPVVIKYKYVISTIPEEMLEIPEPEKRLDTSTATDKQAAQWMIIWERRYQEIERRLKMIGAYQARKLRELSLPPEDVIKN